MELAHALHLAAAGMKVQGIRMRLVAQNLANADSTALAPGSEPYRRQTITFKNALDRALGIETVAVARTGVDRRPLPQRFEPGHPAADADGYVLRPNVDPLLEMMDLREAQRSFEANLNAQSLARTLLQRTVDLLR
jgi:flagellar basal-body rod protein FlgC